MNVIYSMGAYQRRSSFLKRKGIKQPVNIVQVAAIAAILLFGPYIVAEYVTARQELRAVETVVAGKVAR